MNLLKRRHPSSSASVSKILDPQCEARIQGSIRTYVLCLMALTVLAWSVSAVRTYILHEPFDRSTLLAPEPPFTDFLYPGFRLDHLGEPGMLTRSDLGEPYPYPTPSIYAYLLFVRPFHLHLYRALCFYLLFAVLAFTIPAWMFSKHLGRISTRQLPRLAVWVTMLTAFPVIIIIDRGNIEAVMWVLVLLGLVAYLRHRFMMSAILWAAVAAMKISPGLLFALFLRKDRYRVLFTGLAVAVGLTLISLFQVGPTIHQAVRDSSQSAPYLTTTFILGRHYPWFDESIFNAIKETLSVHAYMTNGHHQLPPVLPATRIALLIYNIVAPSAALLLYWFRLRRLPLLNQFIAYVVLFTVLPQVSYEYKLVYLYLVWGVFLYFILTDVVSGLVAMSLRSINIVLLSCAVIFAPLSYLRIVRGVSILAFGGEIKLICLLLILVTVCRVPMPSSLFGDLQLPDPGDAPA
jgi:hypothetical protein